MKMRSIFILLISLIATTEFFISNELLKGYLRSEINLAREVKTPLDSIHEYRIADEAPFKYRLLFPAIIKTTYNAIYSEDNPAGFYAIYKFWSLLFFVSSALTFYWLLSQCGFRDELSFAGTLIFLFLPPMLMAYTLPVHTREDTLAYTLFFLGLTFLLRERRWLFLVVSMLGVIARETLLLLPLLYLFYANDRLIRKLLIAGLPAVVWLSIRYLMGNEPYDMWLGLRWNLDNPDQVIGFLFITFNFLWLSFVLHFLFYKRNMHFITTDLRFFYRSSLFALIVVVVTTFLGGIYNEIRLLYLCAPWMIILFLDCVRNYGSQFRRTIGTRNYVIFAICSLVFCGALLYIILTNRERLIVPGQYAVPYDQWIIISVCYIFIVLLLIPHLLTIFSLKKTLK
jgi:hypothetical protein